MSLESKIVDLTNAVIALTEKINSLSTKPQIEQSAPVVVEQEEPAMPPIPFAAPVENKPEIFIPFNNSEGLTNYVKSAYESLSNDKKAKMSQILTDLGKKLGYSYVNEIKSEHYVTVYQTIEKLKGE